MAIELRWFSASLRSFQSARPSICQNVGVWFRSSIGHPPAVKTTGHRIEAGWLGPWRSLVDSSAKPWLGSSSAYFRSHPGRQCFHHLPFRVCEPHYALLCVAVSGEPRATLSRPTYGTSCLKKAIAQDLLLKNKTKRENRFKTKWWVIEKPS